MIKKTLFTLLGLLVLLMAVAWFAVGSDLYQRQQTISPATAPEDYALQDDSKINLPKPQPLVVQPYNPLKNVYWGDLHVHTVESLDAVLFGTQLTIEDAYRFSKGESLRSPGGELMQLTRPLDFVAITDHAESFGLRTRCKDEDITWFERLNCWVMETPNIAAFQLLRSLGVDNEQAVADDVPAGVYQPKVRAPKSQATFPICSNGEGGPQRCVNDAKTDWAQYIKLADEFNEPGVLTTFAAYEFSPVLENAGKHHRNVIFNGGNLPNHAISSLDVPNALDLWRGLEQNCVEPCDFLTIPHNMNKGWGLFYSRYTWDGKSYTESDWRLRKRREPLAEMYQIKGSSECALGVGATDEECAFSQVLAPCAVGQTTGCAFETGFARQGLKIGLQLDQELGFNPFAFGLMASTDTHNSNPGDVEEWDFVDKIGAATSPAVRRLRQPEQPVPDFQNVLKFHTSGGITAVWAEENTRDSVFAGMQRREAYATSGPRMTLRFFAGWGFDQSIVDDPNAIAVATSGGVPMGGVLYPQPEQKQSPTFFVSVAADLMSAPLQRVQVIKGWLDAAGKTHEKVVDVACADGEVDPKTQRCSDNGAGVDTRNCQLTGNSGAAQLVTAWTDPDYQAEQGAFYYVRALQNPTCRWSTYDAIRLGRQPDAGVPATIRERVWSSPIWIDTSS